MDKLSELFAKLNIFKNLDYDNPKTKSFIAITVVLIFIYFLIVIISLTPDRIDKPAPEVDQSINKDENVLRRSPSNDAVLLKDQNGKYKVFSADPNVSEEILRNKLQIPDDIEFTIEISSLSFERPIPTLDPNLTPPPTPTLTPTSTPVQYTPLPTQGPEDHY